MMGIDSCGMLLSAIHEEEGAEKLNLIMVDNHIPGRCTSALKLKIILALCESIAPFYLL